MPTPSHALLAGLVSLVALGGAARAQIPDEFTNLKLLDPAIEKPEIVSVMRGWAGDLGVRCAHCHVGPDNLQGMDFASDEKATKRTARKMLEMSRVINRELLAGLPVVEEDGRARAQVVSCYTCHRGLARPPRDTVSELLDASAAGGPDGAFARYRELSEEHADAGHYDLRPSTLLRVASRYLDSGELETSRATLAELLELFPEYADAHATLAHVELEAGDFAASQTSLDRAFALEPDNGMARWIGGRLARAREAAAAEMEKPTRRGSADPTDSGGR